MTPAQTIKKDLKKQFPNTKFKVKYEIFVNGDAVRVGWIDGVSSNSVNDFLKKYSNDVKYIQVNREMSDVTKMTITEKLEKYYGIKFEQAKEVMAKLRHFPHELIFAEFKVNNY